MDALDRVDLGAAKDTVSARRPDKGDHGIRYQHNAGTDEHAESVANSKPDAETDGDAVANADAATDSVPCGNSEDGAAANRPARVRVCGHTRAVDRGNRGCGGEEQKTEKARAKEEVTNHDGYRSS